MSAFGWILFVLGLIILAWASLVGLETDIESYRVTNLSALGVGVSFMISGTIFIGSGMIRGVLLEIKDDNRRMIGFPVNKIPEITRDMHGTLFQGIYYNNQQAAEQARANFIRRYGRE